MSRNNQNTPFVWQEPKQKPYALYIHGLGSGAKSGTKSSFGRYFDQYEWLSPEITHDPYESIDILNQWSDAFSPSLVAGTSMGGMLALYVNAPSAIKIAVNPTIEIEHVLRKIGYGKHPYLQERENGETEYVIDEQMVRRFITFREEHTILPGLRNIALFSTDDELVGKEFSKRNAALLEQMGWEVLWSSKFGHRVNEQAVKVVQQYLLK